MDGNDGLADDLAGWGRWLRYAILQVVVRHGVPTVRPDDVLVGLRRVSVAALEQPLGAAPAQRVRHGGRTWRLTATPPNRGWRARRCRKYPAIPRTRRHRLYRWGAAAFPATERCPCVAASDPLSSGSKRPGADRRRRPQCPIPSRSAQIRPNRPPLPRARQLKTPKTVLPGARRRVGHVAGPRPAPPGLRRALTGVNRPVPSRPRTPPPIPPQSPGYGQATRRLAGGPERSSKRRWKIYRFWTPTRTPRRSRNPTWKRWSQTRPTGRSRWDLMSQL